MKKIFAIIVVAFALSFFYRAPYLGHLTGGHWQWINAQPMVFDHNWYKDGAFRSHFVMTYEASGVESPNPSQRTPYISYTPFYLLPVHIMSLILQKPIQIQHIQFLSILIHLLTALLLGFFSFRILENSSKNGKLWAFAAAAVLWILHPVPLYYQSLIYFTDLFILLLFALLLVLETYDPEKNTKIRWTQRFLCILLAISDWYSVAIALALVLARSLNIRKWRDKAFCALSVLAPFLFGWTLHLLHLFWLGKLSTLQQRFTERTGLDSREWPPISDLFHKFFIVNIGLLESVLLLAAFMFFFLGKKKSQQKYQLPPKYFILLFLPPFLHTLLLMEHSYIHAFSTPKFYFPVAIAVCAMGTFWLYEKYSKQWNSIAYFVLIFLAAYCFYIENLFFNGRAAIRTSPKLDIASWIGNLHAADEVVLSHTVNISWNPPTQLALSRTHVWTFTNYEKLLEWKKNTLPSKPVHLLWIEKKEEKREPCLKAFREVGQSIESQGDLEAIRFENFEDFLNLPLVKNSKCLSSS